MTTWTKILLSAWMGLLLVSCQDHVVALDPQSIMRISFEASDK